MSIFIGKIITLTVPKKRGNSEFKRSLIEKMIIDRIFWRFFSITKNGDKMLISFKIYKGIGRFYE